MNRRRPQAGGRKPDGRRETARFPQSDCWISHRVAVQPVWWPLMAILLRRATKADAKYIALLLAELGYRSKEPDVCRRLDRALQGNPSCFLVAQSAGEVIGLIT